MNKNLENYIAMLNKFRTENLLVYHWRRNGMNIQAKKTIDHLLEKENIDKDQFMNFAIETGRKAALLVEGIANDISEEEKKIIYKIFSNDDLENILVQSTSSIKTVFNFDAEILTKRNKIEVEKINGYSILFTITDNEEQFHTFEISIQQAKELIEILSLRVSEKNQLQGEGGETNDQSTSGKN